jgi:hypothetical protein
MVVGFGELVYGAALSTNGMSTTGIIEQSGNDKLGATLSNRAVPATGTALRTIAVKEPSHGELSRLSDR